MRLLVVGLAHSELDTASQMAVAAGADVSRAATCEEAMAHMRAFGADLVMVDVEVGVPTLIAALRAERFQVDVVACGVKNDPRSAVAAVKAGAVEYIPLPPDADLIAGIIQSVSSDRREFIYADPAMQRCMKLVDSVAASNASVLVTGASGTGKELVAREIHKRSQRHNGPFVAVNCAAIPEALLESELFGHEKGAFTGAVARRIGKFEEAIGGTLFLDEISEMDVRLQAKLLRAIQERQIDRVGGGAPVPVDIRILASSNRDLVEAVKAGTFREDLYFRLAVVQVALAPLKDRPADIDVLAIHFVRKFCELNETPLKSISDAAFAALRNYEWPGNVRELENMMHRAVLLAGTNDVGVDHIAFADGSRICPNSREVSFERRTSEGEALNVHVGQSLDEVERELILRTLAQHNWNRNHAQRVLKISLRTLGTKLQKYKEEGFEVHRKGTVELAGAGAR